ncbi:hypothetical protein PR048_026594 [Dryococelus australis]|uniref:Uncharacterized protein n=1 Tax=Dryococelus australis TaxID=614101 RepID=A0ABQ9GLT8_9NEOP|nr:hypothetical protein PR048_026594 [Dryococelus australis]
MAKSALYTKPLLKAFCCLHPRERISHRSCLGIVAISNALPVIIITDVLLGEWRLFQLEEDEEGTTGKCIRTYWVQFFDKNNASGMPLYPNVSKVVKGALSLSHGSADVERDF